MSLTLAEFEARCQGSAPGEITPANRGGVAMPELKPLPCPACGKKTRRQRALTWTKEPPKVPGWYFIRDKWASGKWRNYGIMYVYADKESGKLQVKGWGRTEHGIEQPPKDMEFAGPIPGLNRRKVAYELTDEQCRAMRTWADKTAVDTIDALRADLSRKDAHIAALEEVVEAQKAVFADMAEVFKMFKLLIPVEIGGLIEKYTQGFDTNTQRYNAALARLKEVEGNPNE